ncbi:MAG TPA: hypothetical protein VG944_20070 [Fimbriimonas sp.]|nr:hypothetical protein [Fimbriimonas sp.]
MKNKRLLTIGAACLATFALAAQDPQVIQRTLSENATETYRVVTTTNETGQIAGLGPVAMNITSNTTYVFKTGKVDASKGNADIDATVTVDKIDGGGGLMDGQLEKLKTAPITVKGKIDKRGHLDLTESATGNAMSRALSGGAGGFQTLFIELPDHPVKVGDSWNVVIPKGPFTSPTDQKLAVKLTGEKQDGGKDAWTVDVSGTIDIDVDSTKIPQNSGADPTDPFKGLHAVFKGTSTISGTGMIEKATGKTLTLDTKSDIKLTVQLPDQNNLSIDVTGPVTCNTKLVPDSTAK